MHDAHAFRKICAATNQRPIGIQPEPTAEAILAQATMELAVGRTLDDHLEGQLESIAEDISLPRAIRARALVILARNR